MTTTKGRFNEKSIESLSMGIGIISVVVLLTTGGSISIASMVLLSTAIIFPISFLLITKRNINRLVIRLTRPIINASGFDDKKLEIGNVLLLLLVGLPVIIYIIVKYIHKAFEEYISTVSPSNPLYNSIMTIYKSWQGLCSLFSSPIGLIIIILIVVMVAVIIALEKRSFSSYAGT
ncbi:hypothetical protein HFC64_04285 [Saccharolobus solfataricus]|uniref:Uncharacterized protein n=1 Tax=Saccharolobus solfataricus TaxID=2287 RepID=A0A7S9NQL8_SACSO|nr:hypothetical protein [Saccharolobus solfataricus]QPG49183.1 hypothetical protein HFC64_04285 [Saccharolobus solfataricus]